MLGTKLAGQTLAAITLATGGLIAATGAGAQTVTSTTLCNYQVASVSAHAYKVQNNEWGSTAAECVSTDGGADFTVASSAIANKTAGAPGGYPSIFAGCHWGDCTKGGLASNPVMLGTLGLTNVISSWATTEPSGSGNAYDVAYDLWINQTPATSGKPNGSEIMVWLTSRGGVRPAGIQVDSDVSIDGYRYNIWYQPASTGSADIVTYQMTTQRSSVTNLNIGDLIVNAELNGYTVPSWYLISVEAGFEIWQGGKALTTTSFSVDRKSSLKRTPPSGLQPF